MACNELNFKIFKCEFCVKFHCTMSKIVDWYDVRKKGVQIPIILCSEHDELSETIYRCLC